MNSNFLKTPEFDNIYNSLPETGTSTKEFADFTADPELQKIFHSHFERIKIINCHHFEENEEENSKKETCLPELFEFEKFSGPAALELAQSGKKVAVLIFADSTNVGGIYMTGYSPSGTQEEQTVLMAPEIYGYLGNNFGVHDIGGNGDGIYKANQKRYSLNKDDYEKPDVINPAYGYILTNLLMTHEVQHISSMKKLPKEGVVEVSYAFLSMPSFATDVSRDPIGAMLIGKREEKDGEKIYNDIRSACSILCSDKDIQKYYYTKEVNLKTGKVGIFCSEKKLQDFAEQYIKKDGNCSISDIIVVIIKANIILESEKEKEAIEKLQKELNIENFESFEKDVTDILKEAQKSYEECIIEKFTNLIKGTEKAEADTLILGKIGCGAFLNNENEISKLMGKAIAKSKYIKYIYFAGVRKDDPFITKVKEAMNNEKSNGTKGIF